MIWLVFLSLKNLLFLTYAIWWEDDLTDSQTTEFPQQEYTYFN